MTNLPNLLTFSRIAAIPLLVVAFALSGPAAHWATFGIFVIAGITDLFDGMIARALNQETALGRFLDPIADKLLVAATLIMLIATENLVGVHVFAALVILLREILISGLREFLSQSNIKVPVSGLAKWKTTIQFVALALLLLGDVLETSVSAGTIGVWALWLAAALTVATGYAYLRAGIIHMRSPSPGSEAAGSAPPQ